MIIQREFIIKPSNNQNQMSISVINPIEADSPSSSMEDLFDLEERNLSRKITKLTDIGFGSVMNAISVLCVSNSTQIVKAVPVYFEDEPQTFTVTNAKSMVYMNEGDAIDIKITADKIHTCVSEDVRTSWFSARCDPKDWEAYLQKMDFVEEVEKNLSLNKMAMSICEKLARNSDVNHFDITIGGHCRIEFFVAGTNQPYPFEIEQAAFVLN